MSKHAYRYGWRSTVPSPRKTDLGTRTKIKKHDQKGRVEKREIMTNHKGDCGCGGCGSSVTHHGNKGCRQCGKNCGCNNRDTGSGLLKFSGTANSGEINVSFLADAGVNPFVVPSFGPGFAPTYTLPVRRRLHGLTARVQSPVAVGSLLVELLVNNVVVPAFTVTLDLANQTATAAGNPSTVVPAGGTVDIRVTGQGTQGPFGVSAVLGVGP